MPTKNGKTQSANHKPYPVRYLQYSRHHKLAKVLASELIQEHLEQAIQKIRQKDAIIQLDSEFRDFDWKQTKCALIELIYSWHATEAFGKKN